MWAVAAKCLSDIVIAGIEKKKPTRYFASLYETFQILLNFFYGPALPTDSGLLSTRRLLELFASTSQALIETFYQERLAEQRALQPNCSPLGRLSSKARFHARLFIMWTNYETFVLTVAVVTDWLQAR